MEEEADEPSFDAVVGAAHGLPDDAFRSGALVVVVSDPQASGRRRAWSGGCGRAGCRRISGCWRSGIAAAIAIAAVARLARHGAEQREYGEYSELIISGHGCFAHSARSVFCVLEC